jgi:hypothetical protein
VRRTIFSGGKRSGRATREDLLAAYRDFDLPLYDASVWVRLEGEGLEVTADDKGWRFTIPGGRSVGAAFHFVIRFGESPEDFDAVRPDLPAPRQVRFSGVQPLLHIDSRPAWELFYESVPALVDSCIVRDLGVPRACPGRYYWIWAWDMLVTVAEALRWGEDNLARATVRFVDSHRDIHGVIPARWTRSLLPLDTPSPGGIEFLHAALTYESFLETGDTELLGEMYPRLALNLKSASPGLRESGVSRGAGFYPDVLGPFGRTDEGAVTMETGAWYVLSRIMENLARVVGDGETASLASSCAESILLGFHRNFWDQERGFFADGVDPASGRKSSKHPLFSLLFLHSSLGFPLIRDVLPRAADFIADVFMRPEGVRVIPAAESGEGAEVVLNSWYPHWDVYALKVLRRAGRGQEIVRWLHQSEAVLQNFGYCPEYVEVFRPGGDPVRENHGSASNLNCVTAWYRAVREGVAGFEFDPGGMTHIPLDLQVGRVVMERIRWRGGIWTVEVHYGGPQVVEMSVDGVPVQGCLKIPASHVTPGDHRIVVRYGESTAGVLLKELMNAQILRCLPRGKDLRVAFIGLGFVEGVIAAGAPCSVRVDGQELRPVWSGELGEGYFRLAAHGRHVLEIIAG